MTDSPKPPIDVYALLALLVCKGVLTEADRDALIVRSTPDPDSGGAT